MALHLSSDARRLLRARILPVLAIPMLALLVHRYDAPLVLAVAVLLVASVTLLIWPEVSTLLFVFLLYTNIPVVAHQVHGVPMPLAGSFILLLALPLVPVLVFRRERPKSDPVFGLMLCFLGVLLITTLFARDKGIAFDRVLVFVLEGIVIYWLVINTIRSLATLRRVIWTVLAAGSLLGAFSLYQVVTGSYDQQFGGLAQRQIMDYNGPAGVDPAGSSSLSWSKRAEGPMGSPNRYAQTLIVLLPLALVRVRHGRSRRASLCAAAMGVLILSGVLLSYSRGAMLTFMLLLLLALVLRFARPAYVMAGAVTLALLVPFVAPTLMDRIASLGAVTDLVVDDPSVRADGAIRGRATEMAAALHVFMDYPVLGVGPGQYTPFYSVAYQQNPTIQFRDLREQRRAHSLYLELAAETGMVGLAVFLAIVLLLLRQLWRARRRWAAHCPEFSDMAAAFWFGILAYLGTAVFLHLSYERYYWFLLALAGASLEILRAEGRRPGPRFDDPDAHTAARRTGRRVRVPNAMVGAAG